MIAFPIIYTFIGVLVFVVLQETLGIKSALLVAVLWFPAFLAGFIIDLFEEFYLSEESWVDVMRAQAKDYPVFEPDDVDGSMLPVVIRSTQFWYFWLLVGICYEVYAIISNRVDTLSERVWYWIKKYRILRVAFILFWVWAFIHIVFGPCAFGIC